MRRPLTPILVVLLALASPLRGADGPLARFGIVAIRASTASLYIATVSMTFTPFVRKNVVYASTYSAKVFPYFFWSEKGRIWIVVDDDGVRRVASGKPVDFVGHAVNDSGEERKVQGRATPTGPFGGNIRVKVFVTRRIALTYDTTYELKGSAAPVAAVTPR